jgi:hypothetical protein
MYTVYKNTSSDCAESLSSESDLKPKAPVQSKMGSFGFGFNGASATEQLALFCYTSGVSFVAFENPHFKEFCRLLNASYVLPGRRALSTSLLDAESSRINKWKDGLLSTELLCLTSDGFTDTALVNLINFEALTIFGPIHVGTLQRTEADIWKDADYIASKIKDCVQELGGTERVVGFVSDNENLMTSALSMLEDQFDRFLCAPCLAHVGNSLLKDIGKILQQSIIGKYMPSCTAKPDILWALKKPVNL